MRGSAPGSPRVTAVVLGARCVTTQARLAQLGSVQEAFMEISHSPNPLPRLLSYALLEGGGAEVGCFE